MTIILSVIFGLLLPTIVGWLALSLLEGKTTVLFRGEKWALGFVLGVTLSMYATFLIHSTNIIALNRIGFLLVQLILIVVLGFLWLKRRGTKKAALPAVPASPALPKWLKILIIVVAVWTLLKILSGLGLLALSPPYFDDVISNWNMRGKIFFFLERLELEMKLGNEMVSAQGVSSYPPTVPMVKAWLAALAGQWTEGLVTSVHLFWYLSGLALMFYALRRYLTLPLALLGTYILSSLPLYLIHGTHSYADVFLSVHLFATLSFLYHSVVCKEAKYRPAYFRISALAAGLLIFTKNEALMIYLPVLLLILFASLLMLRTKKVLKPEDVKRAVLLYVASIAAVAVPWMLFKFFNDLPFGNAKAVTGLSLGWQEGVLNAIWINTFFEGNWLLLMPVFIGLLIAKWRQAFRSPLVILTAFFLIVYFGQLFLFLFTSLSTEALRQTGYARGLVQLVPIVVFVTTMLLASFFPQKR